jgi:hypothetical protein
MPIESNEAEDNEEREGDFYCHVHTWSFLLVQPIVAWSSRLRNETDSSSAGIGHSATLFNSGVIS